MYVIQQRVGNERAQAAKRVTIRPAMLCRGMCGGVMAGLCIRAFFSTRNHGDTVMCKDVYIGCMFWNGKIEIETNVKTTTK